MTDHLGHISQLRTAESILYQFVQAYYKVKEVREQLEQTQCK